MPLVILGLTIIALSVLPSGQVGSTRLQGATVGDYQDYVNERAAALRQQIHSADTLERAAYDALVGDLERELELASTNWVELGATPLD